MSSYRPQSAGKVIDDRWLAYMLATVFHETGGTMQRVIEKLNYSARAPGRALAVKTMRRLAGKWFIAA
ncbi:MULTISPECIES: hypothetical protein [Ensifer]|uniref:hypothetical protein n=1 Tax=Ensifer TaxID=106591 RepID=UPI000DD5A4EC|nr:MULTISPECIES: hypothetical protein [Ensifer]MCY1745250.1 hypothetical protein [Ensifer sp. SL37]